jgi:cyclic nucleotide-binding protein/HEAT repeat protein
LKFSYIGLAYVFVGLGILWLIVILLLSGNYIRALTQVITQRRLGEDANVLSDPASVALLRNRLHDAHAGVAVYALTKLEALDEQSVIAELPNLIRHPAAEVRREAFMRIEKMKLSSALNAVQTQYAIENVPAVKESALRALGAIADDHSPLIHALNETDIHSLRGALIGLLKYQVSPPAEQTLLRLLASSSTADRVLAAQVLGEADRTRFAQAHQAALRDPEPIVRREALQSAAKSRQPFLYPLLIEACDSPETSRAASLALIDIGAEILPEIRTAFSKTDAPRERLLTLPKVLAHIGGPLAYAPLRSRIDSFDPELRSQILNALSQCGYRTQSQSEIYTAIKIEIQQTAWACAAQIDLGNMEETALLSAALRHYIAQSRDRVLLLLSFAFDAGSMLRVHETLLTGSTAQLAYALEIIDAQLPSEWKPMIMPLFEDLSPQEQLHRLAKIFPQAQQTGEDRLCALIGGSGNHHFTEWIRACAIYTAVRVNAQACHELIRDAAADTSMLIRDTARWSLAHFSAEAREGKITMLSTIEKVLILKTVNMFSQTPDNILADVANLLEEIDVAENETIFKKGELGDSMYIIVNGKVRVHTDERFLNYLGESDVFGEMALLDPEPRVASVTAVEPTRLFRLDQAPFYQLMSERAEVATGIIRVLTRLLRDRVRDLSQLETRIKELEGGRPF